MTYPASRVDHQTDDFFGTRVDDPYRWLEGSSSDPEIRDWVRAQSEAARRYLDELPGRASMSAVVERLASVPIETAPKERGGRWFRFTTDGLQEQMVFRVADSPTGTGQTLIDPNPLSEASTTSIAVAEPSPDGRFVAYTYSEAGSDWRTWRVREVATGTDLSDLVEWAKFTDAAWLPDSSGFFYGGFPAQPADGSDSLVEANSRHQLRLHRLGTPATDDAVVFELPDEPEVLFEPDVTESGRWLVIYAERGTDPSNRLWVIGLNAQSDDVTGTQLDTTTQSATAVISEATAEWRVVADDDAGLLLYTDDGAPRGRVVRLDLATGERTELIGERTEILQEARAAGGHLVLHWLDDAHSTMTIHDLHGTQQAQFELPGLGSVLEISSKARSNLLHVSFTSFARPRQTLAHDLASGLTSTVFDSGTGGLEDVHTEQRWYISADGTPIPMFLVYTGSVAATGPRPTLLYGYGGFRIPVAPAFNVARAAWIAGGGVLAIPSLRGGGEYGSEWHDAGRLANKQNVFDDAIAAAEFLISGGVTTTGQLACTGGSNGGLLAGALLVQRPDLFAAVVSEVAVLDLLRFTHFTIGWAWTSDYGDPARSEQEFLTAYAYSPYHQLREDVRYPPTMVMTSDHDDRVVPAHSYKFAARLQSVGGRGSIALLRVEIDAGHSAGRARSALVSERLDALAFLSWHTGLKWPT